MEAELRIFISYRHPGDTDVADLRSSVEEQGPREVVGLPGCTLKNPGESSKYGDPDQPQNRHIIAENLQAGVVGCNLIPSFLFPERLYCKAGTIMSSEKHGRKPSSPALAWP